MKKLSLLFALLFMSTVAGCSGQMPAVPTPSPTPSSSQMDAPDEIQWVEEFITPHVNFEPVVANGNSVYYLYNLYNDDYTECKTVLYRWNSVAKKKTKLYTFAKDIFASSGLYMSKTGVLYLYQGDYMENGDEIDRLFEYRDGKFNLLLDIAAQILYLEESNIYYIDTQNCICCYDKQAGRTISRKPIDSMDAYPFLSQPYVLHESGGEYTLFNRLTGAIQKVEEAPFSLSSTEEGSFVLMLNAKENQTGVDALDITSGTVSHYVVPYSLTNTIGDYVESTVDDSLITSDAIYLLASESDIAYANTYTIYRIDRISGEVRKFPIGRKGLDAVDTEYKDGVWYITGAQYVPNDPDDPSSSWDFMTGVYLYAFDTRTGSIKRIWKADTNTHGICGPDFFPQINIVGREIWFSDQFSDDTVSPFLIYTIK